MQSYDGAKGQANMNVTPASGFQITATYLVQATFQSGKAEIRINLIRENGEWKILGFRVGTPSS
jgi:stress response protein SCP2